MVQASTYNKTTWFRGSYLTQNLKFRGVFLLFPFCFVLFLFVFLFSPVCLFICICISRALYVGTSFARRFVISSHQAPRSSSTHTKDADFLTTPHPPMRFIWRFVSLTNWSRIEWKLHWKSDKACSVCDRSEVGQIANLIRIDTQPLQRTWRKIWEFLWWKQNKDSERCSLVINKSSFNTHFLQTKLFILGSFMHLQYNFFHIYF